MYNLTHLSDLIVACFRHDKSIKHFYIYNMDSSFYLQDKYFSSVDKLIIHYKHEDVPNMEGIKHIRLTYPIKNVNEKSAAGDHLACSETLATPTATGHKSESNTYTKNVKGKKTSRKSKFFLPLPGGGKKKDDGGYAALRQEAPPAPARQAPAPSLSDGHSSGATETQQPNNGPVTEIAPETTSASVSVSRTPSEHLSERARAPLPTPRHGGGQDGGDKHYYSSVHDMGVSQLPALINMLQVDERARCNCGLYFDEAELPRGWTMHLSHDAGTDGLVFFMGPDKQTAWNPPLEVACELSLEQQDRIRVLLETYQKDHMSAVSSPGPGSANSHD